MASVLFNALDTHDLCDCFAIVSDINKMINLTQK